MSLTSHCTSRPVILLLTSSPSGKMEEATGVMVYDPFTSPEKPQKQKAFCKTSYIVPATGPANILEGPSIPSRTTLRTKPSPLFGTSQTSCRDDPNGPNALSATLRPPDQVCVSLNSWIPQLLPLLSQAPDLRLAVTADQHTVAGGCFPDKPRENPL